MDIEQIATQGIVFKKGKEEPNRREKPKVKTKAKKTSYIKGTHNSAAAKMKAARRKKKAGR